MAGITEGAINRHEAEARLREISDLIVSLRINQARYPANGYMIQRLKQERLQIMQQFIKLVPPIEAVSLPSPHDV